MPRWRGVAAVDAILPGLKKLPGFISQTLYKDDEGIWVDLYHWDTRGQAEESTDLMGTRPEFQQLLELIDMPSISIDFLSLPG